MLRAFRSLIDFARAARVFMKVLKDLRRPLADGQRGGQAPALREHRDREGSPTGKALRYETPSGYLRLPNDRKPGEIVNINPAS